MNLSSANGIVNRANAIESNMSIGAKRVQTLPKRIHKKLEKQSALVGYDMNKIIIRLQAMLQPLSDEEYTTWVLSNC